jgi:hypothetical protein
MGITGGVKSFTARGLHDISALDRDDIISGQEPALCYTA